MISWEEVRDLKEINGIWHFISVLDEGVEPLANLDKEGPEDCFCTVFRAHREELQQPSPAICHLCVCVLAGGRRLR